MALAFRLQKAGYTPTELTTEAAVSLEPDGERFHNTCSALALRATVPDLSQPSFPEIAKDAELNCPVSRALKIEITLDAKLV
jgi:osmotically inducible protein OsmC